MRPSAYKILLLLLPIIAWCYIGLFITMALWYPAGLDQDLWREHLLHFTVVYVLWLIVLFAYTLFDLSTFRSSTTIISRLIAAMLTNAVIATVYFYFQPELILTPRRFLLVHLAITTVGLAIWYALVQYILPRIWQRQLYLHSELYEQNLASDIQQFLATNNTLGWQFSGQFNPSYITTYERTTVLLPSSLQASTQDLEDLFRFKRLGVEFLDHHRFYELTQRTVPLSGLNQIWFLHSVSYGRHQVFDAAKRLMDIAIGVIGSIVAIIAWPIIGVLIKFTSPGSILFKQQRVGQNGRVFTLYKFRSMSGGATDTWTQLADIRITPVGKWLRRLRLDELPQFFNILKGDMSLVGPRPEQVHIVEQLKDQIPFYNERHIVKPGLTGWSQLHIYANDLASTKQKLEYDLYYIKHRGILLDIEIVLRTAFHMISMQGQ